MLVTRSLRSCLIIRNQSILHRRILASKAKTPDNPEPTTETSSSKPPNTKWFWRTFFLGSFVTVVYVAGKPRRPDDKPGILAYGPRTWNKLTSFFSVRKQQHFYLVIM